MSTSLATWSRAPGGLKTSAEGVVLVVGGGIELSVQERGGAGCTAESSMSRCSRVFLTTCSRSVRRRMAAGDPPQYTDLFIDPAASAFTKHKHWL